MFVTVTLDDLQRVENHGSVITVTGLDEDARLVRFGGDARPMTEMLSALVSGFEGDEVTVWVEDWQITRVAQAS